MTNEAVRAACLTPPGVGGVAVIQVVGPGADALVEAHLRSRRPIDLASMGADQTRLCQIVEGEEVIDDVVVCVRRGADGTPVVDLGLHGGPRVVQRVLMLLNAAGARMVEPHEILAGSWPARNAIESEAIQALLAARTRAVAAWLARIADRLTAEIEADLDRIGRGDLEGAREHLAGLRAGAGRARHLLEGVRCVLTGEPNTGKSTLANTLAEREHAVVSDVPGTTRDWTEHPSAIDGVPVTYVDTAGLRPSDDPIEMEAIRRARQQIESADLILQISDLSIAPGESGGSPLPGEEGWRTAVDRPVVFVWNKSDLPRHPAHEPAIRQAGRRGVLVSARTGTGLSDLRQRLVDILKLTGGPDWPAVPFTPRQVEACRSAEAALGRSAPDGRKAAACLRFLMDGR